MYYKLSIYHSTVCVQKPYHIVYLYQETIKYLLPGHLLVSPDMQMLLCICLIYLQINKYMYKSAWNTAWPNGFMNESKFAWQMTLSRKLIIMMACFNQSASFICNEQIFIYFKILKVKPFFVCDFWIGDRTRQSAML